MKADWDSFTGSLKTVEVLYQINCYSKYPLSTSCFFIIMIFHNVCLITRIFGNSVNPAVCLLEQRAMSMAKSVGG